VARVAPLSLRTSATIRLRRVARDAVYKEELRQLVVPLPRGSDVATVLRELLTELVPAEEGAIAS
jgi:transcription-repair coupling factor (superfamily II helicase)